VLFHGLDPSAINASGSAKVVNLSLNGMLLQHQAQLLRERVASGRAPSVAVLEFRHVTVEHDSWIRGPYFRLWASPKEFFDSRFYYWNPSLAVTFGTNRVLPTFRYREALNNWLSDSARALGPARQTFARNSSTADEMRAHYGMVRATFENRSLASYRGPVAPRKWAVDAAGERWLGDFLDDAAAHNIDVVLALPPAPPYLIEEPGPLGFHGQFDAYVARLRRAYPTLSLTTFIPTGYDLDAFADEIHLSARGREKLSTDFAHWFDTYRVRRLTARAASAREAGAARVDADLRVSKN
jgi:hypothetical protein